MSLTQSSVHRVYNAEYERHDRARRRLVDIIEPMLSDLAPREGIRPVPLVESSVKGFPSYLAKAQRYEREGHVTTARDCITKIGDFARARIICQTIDDADRIAKLMVRHDALLFKNSSVEVHGPEPDRASTGYRAIHLDLEVDAVVDGRPRATRCELQVVTALQYAWGLYTHKDFYKGTGVPPLVAEMMRELSDLLNVADKVAGHLIREVETAHP